MHQAETAAVIVRELHRTDPLDAKRARDMAESVFRQLSGAPRGHSACLTDTELADYLAGHGWTWREVVRRNS